MTNDPMSYDCAWGCKYAHSQNQYIHIFYIFDAIGRLYGAVIRPKLNSVKLPK